jgi:hypothetical protein
MIDQNFTTSISVNQTSDEVYSAILHVDGWWTGSNEGTFDEIGETFVHRHEESHYCRIQVTELDPGQKIAWLVLENRFGFGEDADEWVGTRITFNIAEAEGRTRVDFAHVGLAPELECFEVCSNAWGSLINGSLRGLIAATGQGQV